MAAEKGRAFVLKVGDGATSEEFTTVGGARTTSLAIAGELVNIADKDSAGWRELLADAGEKSVSVGAAGVFKDTVSEATMRTNAMEQTIDNYEILFESGDKFEGAFQILNLEFTGEHLGARMYTFTLESSGEISYTPAA